MASQVNEVYENITEFKTFKADVMRSLQEILDNQNTIRQELFVLRTNQGKTETNDKKSVTVSETYATKAAIAKTNSPVKVVSVDNKKANIENKSNQKSKRDESRSQEGRRDHRSRVERTGYSGQSGRDEISSSSSKSKDNLQYRQRGRRVDIPRTSSRHVEQRYRNTYESSNDTRVYYDNRSRNHYDYYEPRNNRNQYEQWYRAPFRREYHVPTYVSDNEQKFLPRYRNGFRDHQNYERIGRVQYNIPISNRFMGNYQQGGW